MNKHISDKNINDEEMLAKHYVDALMKSAREKQLDPIKISTMATYVCCQVMVKVLESSENDKNLWFDLEGLSRFVAENLKKHALKLEQLANRVEVQ